MNSEIENIANSLIRVRKLQFPIDVKKYASNHFDLIYDPLVDGLDGLCIKDIGRPRIIVNDTIMESRQLFTIAHEIGHHTIPWHLGERACLPDVNDKYSLGDAVYEFQESEANEFASCFLMPYPDLQRIISSSDDLIHAANELISKTQLSHSAVMLGINRYNKSMMSVNGPIQLIFTGKDCLCKFQCGTGSIGVNNFEKNMHISRFETELTQLTSGNFHMGKMYVYGEKKGARNRLKKLEKPGRQIEAILVSNGVKLLIAKTISMKISGLVGAVNSKFKNGNDDCRLHAIRHKIKSLEAEMSIELSDEIHEIVNDWISSC